MKLRKFSGIMLAVCVTGVSHAAMIEKPVVIKEAMLSATVSDLHGFIDGIGSVASQINPMLNGMMIKMQLGAQIGDPGLSGLAPGSGLAVVLMDPTNVFAVAEIEEAQKDLYAGLVEGMGLSVKYSEGLLVACSDESQLDKYAALAPAVQQQLLAKRSPSIRVSCEPQALISRYENEIQTGLQMMISGMQMELDGSGMDVSRLLEGEVRVLLSLARQCATAEIELDPRNGTIRVNETVVAVPESHLNALLKASAANTATAGLHCGVLKTSAVSYDGLLPNSEALATFIKVEAAELASAMSLSEDALTNWVDCYKKWLDISTGTVCETFGFGENGTFMSYRGAMAVKADAKVVDLFKAMGDDMKPILAMYEKAGVPMSIEFTENARAYKEIKIHQLKMAFSPVNPEIQMVFEMMKLTDFTMDIALVDGTLLYAMGDKIEELIDRVQDTDLNAKKLAARGVYPSGGTCYIDVDIVKYIRGLIEILPEEAAGDMAEMKPFLSILDGSDPITMAAFQDNGAAQFSLNIPESLISKIGQAAMMAMMQMQQGMQMQMEEATMELDDSSF